MTHIPIKTDAMLSQLNDVIDMDNVGSEAAHNIRLEIDDELGDIINQTINECHSQL